jgi:hypothetical protein
MCRHIISVIKGTELRRNLFKSGGIGKKWSTEKFAAFADFAPSSNEILAQQMQTLFPAKILLPMVSWKRGRPKKARALSASEKYHREGLKKLTSHSTRGSRLWHLPAAWSQQEDSTESESFPCGQRLSRIFSWMQLKCHS